MLSCKEIARLVSDGLDRKLPLRRRIAVRLHLAMCSGCRAYKKQIQSLNQLFSRRAKREPHAQSLSAEGRERIKASLREGPH